jgi:hypothetical protein
VITSDKTPYDDNPYMRMAKSIVVGELYEITLGRKWGQTLPPKNYRVHSIERQSDFCYTLFCQCPKTMGVIYLWIKGQGSATYIKSMELVKEIA